MKVGFAIGDWRDDARFEDGTPIYGGSGWIRFGQYAKHSKLNPIAGELIRERGTNILGVRDWDGVEHLDCDVVIMQRWMHQSLPAAIKDARKQGQVIINDIDDWYWGLSPHNLAFYMSHPRANKNENVDHYRRIAAVSTGVLTSTPVLADRLTKFVNPDKIVVIDNHVEFGKFTPRTHTEKGRPTIGWVGSTAHRSNDIAVLRPAAREVRDEFRFHHSGDSEAYVPFAIEIGIDDVTVHPAVPPQRLPELFTFDIGVVPLSKAAFNESKSWIKGLEYVAAGVPFVASPLPEYVRMKEEYGVGRLAKNTTEWVKHLRELRDPDLRQAEAAANLEATRKLDVVNGAELWDAAVLSFI